MRSCLLSICHRRKNHRDHHFLGKNHYAERHNQQEKLTNQDFLNIQTFKIRSSFKMTKISIKKEQIHFRTKMDMCRVRLMEIGFVSP